MRIPGVLQRIGLCYRLVGVYIRMSARVKAAGWMAASGLIAGAAGSILLSYWVLLYFVPVPVPGQRAPGFDPEGSWQNFSDRAVIGVDHFFPYGLVWRSDGAGVVNGIRAVVF